MSAKSRTINNMRINREDDEYEGDDDIGEDEDEDETEYPSLDKLDSGADAGASAGAGA